MEKKLNLFPKLSLNEMALRRVAVNLWSDSSIFASMQKVRKADDVNRRVLEKIIHRVKEKVSKLVLPKSLNERMMLLVRPIGKEILRWKLCHERILNVVSNEEFYMRFFEQLCWTCTGAIDCQRTAELLIRLEMLDIEKRYRLACFYCLENYIPVLWVDLPEEYKSRFVYGSGLMPEIAVHLEYYWTSILKGEECKWESLFPGKFIYYILNLYSIHEFFLQYTACKGSKAATKYFFQKLSVRDRENVLGRVLFNALGTNTSSNMFGNNDEKPISDVLYYLLSVMSEEQQMEVFKADPDGCLMCLHDWPWHDLSLDTTVLLWNLIPKSHYDYVLDRLEDRIFTSGYYFPHLFQKFFMCSPTNFRKYFVDLECLNGELPLFSKFLLIEDAETIRVILRNIDSDDKRRLLTQQQFIFCLSTLMSRGKWHFIGLCFGEATLSKEDRKMLKESCMGLCGSDCRKSQWKQMFELLDGTSASSNSTKCSGDETLTKAKRLSSEEEKCDSSMKLKRH